MVTKTHINQLYTLKENILNIMFRDKIYDKIRAKYNFLPTEEMWTEITNVNGELHKLYEMVFPYLTVTPPQYDQIMQNILEDLTNIYETKIVTSMTRYSDYMKTYNLMAKVESHYKDVLHILHEKKKEANKQARQANKQCEKWKEKYNNLEQKYLDLKQKYKDMVDIQLDDILKDIII